MIENITNQYSQYELEAMAMQAINLSLDKRAHMPVVGGHTAEFSSPSIRGNEVGLSKQELTANIISIAVRMAKHASPGSEIKQLSNGYTYQDSYGSHKDYLDKNLNWVFCNCKHHQED